MARLLIVEDQPELAALIGSAARVRGHQTVEMPLGRGAIALLDSEAFDAAVVDLLLPDVRSTEVLGRLKALAVPTFAISGVFRDDRYATEAVTVHGARTFFQKPFEMDALLDAVEDVTGAPLARRALGLDDLEELERPPAPKHEADVALPFDQRQRVWGHPPVAPNTEKRTLEPSSGGKLAPATLARLLNAYYQARHTGELKLRHDQVVKVIFFEAGQPVYAASNLAHERFARFCARRGVIREADLPAIAALAKETGIRTGEAMVRLGLLTDERRRELLVEQVKEIIWSAFSWTDGEFTFTPRRPARADLVMLTVYPANLILEGVRREPLVALRKKMPPHRRLFPASDPPYPLHEVRLFAAEARLLVWADGSKSVEDLVALSDLTEREVLGNLYGFELLGLVEELDRPRRDKRISFGL